MISSIPCSDAARNGGVTLKVYTDNNTAYTDLMAGNLDLVDDVPAQQLKNVRSDLGDRYLNTPAGIIQTLAFPHYDREWNKAGSVKVRKGLSRAIDREQARLRAEREAQLKAERRAAERKAADERAAIAARTKQAAREKAKADAAKKKGPAPR